MPPDAQCLTISTRGSCSIARCREFPRGQRYLRVDRPDEAGRRARRRAAGRGARGGGDLRGPTRTTAPRAAVRDGGAAGRRRPRDSRPSARDVRRRGDSAADRLRQRRQPAGRAGGSADPGDRACAWRSAPGRSGCSGSTSSKGLLIDHDRRCRRAACRALGARRVARAGAAWTRPAVGGNASTVR